MKIPTTIVLPVVTLAALLAGCASPDSEIALATRERFLDMPIESPSLFEPTGVATLYIKRGDSRDAVLFACGRPESVLNANLWVYRDGDFQSQSMRKSHCDTLLVAFVADRVVELKLVNREVLEAELAKQPQRVGQTAPSF